MDIPTPKDRDSHTTRLLFRSTPLPSHPTALTLLLCYEVNNITKSQKNTEHWGSKQLILVQQGQTLPKYKQLFWKPNEMKRLLFGKWRRLPGGLQDTSGRETQSGTPDCPAQDTEK